MKCLFFAIGIFITSIGYSQEPPSYFDIMKWYFVGFPKKHNGWKIEYKRGHEFTGYTEGILFAIVNLRCDTCGYLDQYSYDILFDYGNSETATLKVTQNKDTTDKYFKIEYPLFPNSIEPRKRKKL